MWRQSVSSLLLISFCTAAYGAYSVTPRQDLHLKLSGRQFADNLAVNLVTHPSPVDEPWASSGAPNLMSSLRVGYAIGESQEAKLDSSGQQQWANARKDEGLSKTLFGENSVTARLSDWVNAQADESITPEKFFEESLRLSQGNISLGIVACWNMLTLGRDLADRVFLEKTRKFIDIRGDLSFLAEYHGDADGSVGKWTSRAENYSAWYHFWGGFLYSYSLGVRYPLARPLLWPYYGLVIAIEEGVATGVPYARGLLWDAATDLPRRTALDIQGFRAGNRLAANLNRWVLGRPSPDPQLFLKRKQAPSLTTKNIECEDLMTAD